MCKKWKKIVAVFGVALMLGNINGTLMVHAEEITQEESNEEKGEGNKQENNENATIGQETDAKKVTDENEKAEDIVGENESEKANDITGENESEEANNIADENENKKNNNITGENESKSDEASNEANLSLLDVTSSELQAATNLSWDSEHPGVVKFHNPNNEKVSYIIRLNEPNGYFSMSGWCNEKGNYSIDLSGAFEQSGEYTFQIYFFEEGVELDWSFETGTPSAISSVFQYTRPDTQLDVPANITWDSSGLVTWDAVEHAQGYECALYRLNNGSYELVYVYGITSNTLMHSFADEIATGYDYAIRVRAISSNINKYANGNYSDYILFDNSDSTDEINGTLDEATKDENLASNKIESTVSDVKSAYADADKKAELQVAMQSDTDTQEKISKLEESYSQKLGVSVETKDAGDSGIDTSSVQLLGAALNATQTGKITFSMSKPDEQTQKNLITKTPYSSGIVFDFDLEGAGIQKGDSLAIPVTVTMPVPEGINLNKLAILHFNQSTGDYELLPIRKNSNGTISFTVLHFSYFAFVETEQTSNTYDGTNAYDNSTDNGMNMYFANTNDGSENESVVIEVWKPTTPDEIKRYSVVGREKVVYSINQQNTYPITIKNEMQGSQCFASFEAVLGEYTIGRTYNILPNSQKVYKMEQAATFTLTIPRALQQEGREFQMICVTEKGIPIILKDQDKDSATITVTTNQFYAFALVYKDAEETTK